VEVKKSASPGKEAVKHFRVLDPIDGRGKAGEPEGMNIRIGNGAVVCMANDLLPLDQKNWYVPAWLI